MRTYVRLVAAMVDATLLVRPARVFSSTLRNKRLRGTYWYSIGFGNGVFVRTTYGREWENQR